MADPDRSWADAATADDVVENPSRQRGEVVPPVGDAAAGIGDDVRTSGRRATRADDEPAGPAETADAPAADAQPPSAGQAGDDWVPL
jgi:hypothetical protein